MREKIVGGLIAASAVGLGIGGYVLGENLNDNPEGSHIEEEQALAASRAGYIALAGESDCEATVLSTLATLDDEWYEPPKSQDATQDALRASCQDSGSQRHAELAMRASTYFSDEVSPAISRLEKARDDETYDLFEKIASVSSFASVGALTMSSALKPVMRNKPRAKSNA